MIAVWLFVHFRNDQTLRYRMHGKAQDAVVARFGEDLRNMAFYRAFAQVQLSCNFLACFCFADQAQDADLRFIERRSVREDASGCIGKSGVAVGG